jgi:TraM recognition site of TraD and TraG
MDPLDRAILNLSGGNVFTTRNACEGVHIFGGIGSGKTSGSGRALASAYLRAGFGGLVLCAKDEEIDLWLRYAQENGRAKSVILFNEQEGLNFLNVELSRQGMDGIGGVVECLTKIVEGQGGVRNGGDGNFFDKAAQQLLRYSVTPLYAAYGYVRIADVIAFIASSPKNPQQFDPNTEVGKAFQERSFFGQTMTRVWRAPKVRIAERDAQNLLNFWAYMWAEQIPEKTRGNIVISVSASLDRFQHGRLRSMFCERSSIVPEMSFQGAIVICAMPALTWNEDGVVAQKLVKLIWQRALLARNALEPKFRSLPVFIWADEAQYFVTPDDAKFISTARSSRAAVVYLTQSLPNYYANMAGDTGRAAAEALIGMFGTKIFHANACMTTNAYASTLLGKEIKRRGNFSQSKGENYSSGQNSGYNDGHGGHADPRSHNFGTSGGWGSNKGTSSGYSEVLEDVLQPNFFTYGLRTGGPKNRGLVDAIMHRTGVPFNHGTNDLPVVFGQ